MKKMMKTIIGLSLLVLSLRTMAAEDKNANKNPQGAGVALEECDACKTAVTANQVVGTSKIQDLPSKTGEQYWRLPGKAEVGSEAGSGADSAKGTK